MRTIYQRNVSNLLIAIRAIVGSLLSLVFRVNELASSDLSWTLAPVGLARYLNVTFNNSVTDSYPSVLEMELGIICICMPSVSKIVHHHFPYVLDLPSSLYKRFTRITSIHNGDKHSQVSTKPTAYPLEQLPKGHQYRSYVALASKSDQRDAWLACNQPVLAKHEGALVREPRVKTFIGAGGPQQQLPANRNRRTEEISRY